ncbi:MAG: histidine phosphatase family protein [Mucilaginibacter sp.]
MTKPFLLLALIFFAGSVYSPAYGQPAGNLKIVIIRHGEKSETGDNLNCAGLNRAMQLPKVLVAKFGVPVAVYVPAINSKKSASHARMFQTASPLGIKYNLAINTKYDVQDYAGLAQNLESRTGTVLLVWEHKALDNIIKALGVKAKGLKWGEADFDSIWIVTFKNGKAVLTMDKEGIKPAGNCQF